MRDIGVNRRTLRIGYKGIDAETDESVMSFDYSPECINFTFRGGALCSDIGLMQAQGYYQGSPDMRYIFPPLPEGCVVGDAFLYRRLHDGTYDDRIVVRTLAEELWSIKLFSPSQWVKIEGCTLSRGGCAVNYNYNGKDVLIVSSPESGMTIIDGDTATAVPDAPRLHSLAVHYERIYGTVSGRRNEVWFSDDFDPMNWTVSSQEGGFISFSDDDGDVIKAVSFAECLFIFREHGIYRLTAYGDQSEFVLKKVFTNTGLIYKDTICVCGDRIIFLASEGLYSFDGYGAVRMAKQAPKVYNKEFASAAYVGGRYYLACAADIEAVSTAGYFNNCIIEYDIAKKSIAMLAPADVYSLRAVESHHASALIAVMSGADSDRLYMLSGVGDLPDGPTEKVYRTPYSTLGYDGYKTVRQVSLCSRYPVTLSVIADGKEYDFGFAGGDRQETVFVGRSGKKIGFRLSAQSAYSHISPITVRLDVSEGV